MVTIILAAGYGTRLYPLTLDKPKAMLEVGGKTILDRLMDQIAHTGECEKAVIVTNEKFHRSFETWADKTNCRFNVRVINDGTKSNETRIGAIGDINLALEEGNFKGKDLLVTGSDNLFDMDMRKFVEFAKKNRPSSSMALFDIGDRNLAKQYGICAIDRDFLIKDFEEKPKDPKSTLAATALYFIPKESAPKVAEYMKTDLPKDAPGNLMKWLAKVDKLFGYVIKTGWYDIGDIDSLKRADEEFTRKEKK